MMKLERAQLESLLQAKSTLDAEVQRVANVLDHFKRNVFKPRRPLRLVGTRSKA